MSGVLRVMSASILLVSVGVACSETAKNSPSGQSGSAAASQGGDSDGGGGKAPGKAGNSAQSGSDGTGGTGGSSQVGEGGAGGGEAEGGAGGGAGVPATGPYQAVFGKLCSVESTIGVVRLAGFPAPYLQVTLYDRKDPWLGAPELSNETCAYHQFVDGACSACDAEEVCSLAGECVPEPRTIKDAKLLVNTGGDEREYSANPQLGGIYSELDIGDATSSYAMQLSWGEGELEVEINLAAMAVAGGELTDVMVTTEGDYATPGALDATWQPTTPGAFVRSRIPINHHAGGPTFTDCAAPESSGAFHADAEMIDPLAVITGLEFQGLDHVFVAAARTPQGCVEFRFGEQIFAFPN